VEFFHTAIHFLRHWLLEINDHSLHSPYLFTFYSEVIKASKMVSSDSEIEALRKRYLRDHRKILPGGMGAGSRFCQNRTFRLSDIARSGITKARYSKLLLSIINFYECRTVIELGTSLGLNTLYLSHGNKVKHLLTFEGNPVLAQLAEEHFKTFSTTGIELIRGNLDHTLFDQLKQVGEVDFAYLDANHTKEATLRYFKLLRPHMSDRSILVFDDIYWSHGMTEAWNTICLQSRKKLCLDLFQVGILINDGNAPDRYFRLAF
jgi:predicted O-methyltransferase YrrM